MMSKGFELKMARLSLGLTQNDAATYVGQMSQQSWQKLEKNQPGCVIHDDIWHTLDNIERFVNSMFESTLSLRPKTLPWYNDVNDFTEKFPPILYKELSPQLAYIGYKKFILLCKLLYGTKIEQ